MNFTHIGAALCCALAAVATPASAASLLGEAATITDSYDEVFIAYTHYAWGSSQTLNRTIGLGTEVSGVPGDETTFGGYLDIDPVNKRIWVSFVDYAYGVLLGISNWQIKIAVSPNASEMFTGITNIYHVSALANYSATYTSNSLTLDLSGGYYSTNRFGTRFTNIYEYTTAPNIVGNAVPEPATWAMLLAGFGMAGAALRRRKSRLTGKSAGLSQSLGAVRS